MIKIIGDIENIDIAKVGGKSSNSNYLKYKNLPVSSGIIVENEYFLNEEKEDILKYIDRNKFKTGDEITMDGDTGKIII